VTNYIACFVNFYWEHIGNSLVPVGFKMIFPLWQTA